MLSAAKLPLFFWAEAITTACFTQNRSLVIPRQEKTPYHIINKRKPTVKFFHIFSSLCYIVIDGENLDKMKENGDACIFMGYATQSRGYKVYNKRTRLIVETIHVNFDELPLMTLMFDEYFNGASIVVSKYLAVSTAYASDKRQQTNTNTSTSTTITADITQLDIQTTPEPTTQAPIATAIENINQAENVMVDEDEFINIFEYHWTKDHPLEQVLGNPSQPVRTRRQLENDGKICMFALIVSHTEPKNIKEAMADHAWIKAMQLELHQFKRLDVWELVNRPYGKNVINMKWLWKNKRDEENTIIRNKARLVAKGYR
ncbi:integrase, catalytic region, zinc finger, CCHC-type containing protein [Tanacetum coccineum]